jgi:hypothetical protein
MGATGWRVREYFQSCLNHCCQAAYFLANYLETGFEKKLAAYDYFAA